MLAIKDMLEFSFACSFGIVFFIVFCGMVLVVSNSYKIKVVQHSACVKISKFANLSQQNPSLSRCVRTACSKLLTSLEQVVIIL